MLISNRRINGPITMIAEMKSGGVTRVATMVKMTYATFLDFASKKGFNIPSLVKSIITIGISNKNPMGNVKFKRNLKYFSAVYIVISWSVANVFKNANTLGKRTKYPNEIPTIKQIRIEGRKRTTVLCFPLRSPV